MENEKRCWPCDEPITEHLPPCPLQCGSEKCKAYQRPVRVDTTTRPMIWILGGPGSGKGTQCKKITAKYGFTHLSTGDLLREEAESGSEQAKCLKDIIERGELVPNDVVLDLLKEAVIKRIDKANGFLIDGYPREEAQGHAFEKNIAPVTAVLYFEAAPDTLTKRLLSRGKGQSVARVDDNEETIKYRIRTFYENNNKVLAQYPHRVYTINAERDVEAIFKDVQNVLDPIVAAIAKK